jgi:plastocyanin
MFPRIRAALTALLLTLPCLAAAAQPAPRVHTVVIDGMQFIPQTIEVKPGDTVVWRNKDPFPHTATAAGGGPDSPAIAAGASWKFTAKKRGSYPYLCTLHRTMTGRLVVK